MLTKPNLPLTYDNSVPGVPDKYHQTDQSGAEFKGLTVVLEVAAGVDGLELRDRRSRGGDVGGLQRRALDEPRRAAGVRTEQVWVGHHPERGVVLHYAALGVPARAAPGDGGECLGEFEGRLEFIGFPAGEPHADLGAGALQFAPRSPHTREPAAAWSCLEGGGGLGFWPLWEEKQGAGSGADEDRRHTHDERPGRCIFFLGQLHYWTVGWMGLDLNDSTHTSESVKNNFFGG